MPRIEPSKGNVLRSSGKLPEKAISQKSRSHAGGVNGVPEQAQRSALRGERRSSEMSELSAFAGSEGYGACDDEGDWGTPQQARKRPITAFAESGRFLQVYIHLPCLPVFSESIILRPLMSAMTAHSFIDPFPIQPLTAAVTVKLILPI